MGHVHGWFSLCSMYRPLDNFSVLRNARSLHHVILAFVGFVTRPVLLNSLPRDNTIICPALLINAVDIVL